jgi:chorismate dehydratase
MTLRYGEPGELADALELGRLDAALIPSIEYLRGVGAGFVPGPALVVKGRTGAILLVTNRPIDTIRRIAVSPNCRTPVAALRIVLDKLHHIMPDFCVSRVDASAWRDDYDAILLAGDQGIRYRQIDNHPDEISHDIGAMWWSLHKKPLVLALWAYNDAAVAGELGGLLVESRNRGVEDLASVADTLSRETSYTRESVHQLLSDGLGYDLGPTEEEGLRLLEDYALQYQLSRRRRLTTSPAHVTSSLSATAG